MLSWLSLTMLGLSVGFLGTVMGVGGGFIVGPVLLSFYALRPGEVAGTSLVVVFLNALSGTIAYYRQGRIVFRTGTAMSVFTVPGSVLGAILTGYIDRGPFTVLFAVMLIVAALRMIERGREGSDATKGQKTASLRGPREWLLVGFLAFLSGIISGFFGVGGGIVHVPLMILLLGFPVHFATATSHFILTITSIIGVSSHAFLGNVNAWLALPVGLGALAGAQLGARTSLKLSGRALEIVFAAFLLAMSANLLYQALG
ncbi:MAG: sulfite exporter TauE/SafE family protein [Candidatus Caldarchaeales archaeon]|nr:sulfite exporter TauE/SafE family protein [Candidatus Caldarchaeales archaeon]MDT7915560.1 sulfite exporter TauE/SafE family protein [Candidatus Caldarchaeales archaeon]